MPRDELISTRFSFKSHEIVRVIRHIIFETLAYGHDAEVASDRGAGF